MGTEPGQHTIPIIEELKKDAPSFNVFQAVYIGERIGKKRHLQRDDEKLEQTGLRFRPYEMYVFPTSDIRSFSEMPDYMQYVFNFMGLYGINAPLPRCYHEQVAIQQSVHDEGKVPIQNFLDIFNNRFYWLYYHAWKKYRAYLQLVSEETNKTSQRIFSFIGLGFKGEERDRSISPFKLFQLSGILSGKVKNRGGLQTLLQEFFPGVAFRIREFIPSMVPLNERPKVGRSDGSDSHRLGKNSVLGRSVKDYLSKICIHAGPIDFDDYLSFLPGGGKMNLLKKLINLYLNDSLMFDIRFSVRADTVQSIPWNDKRIRLGYSMWLGRPKDSLTDVYFPFEKINN
jgi:type VI secretion system protein ImpH